MRTPLLIAAIALIATACGGGEADPAAPTETSAAATAAPGEGGTEGPDDGVTRCASFDEDCVEKLPPDTVELRGIQFKPGSLEVSAGTTVTFDNLDAVVHTVTAGTPDAPDTGAFDVDLDANESTTLTFDEAGEFAYFCEIHPGAMQATIVVT